MKNGVKNEVTAKELWEEFTAKNSLVNCEYDAWSFGVEADLLADLVAAGKKTATASAYPLYEVDHLPLPAPEAYSVVLDAEDNAVCIIQTRKVTVVAFNEVTAEHAYKEGEGDRSLAFWRETHERFFKDCMHEVGLQFSPDMKVVCEEFVVVYKRL